MSQKSRNSSSDAPIRRCFDVVIDGGTCVRLHIMCCHALSALIPGFIAVLGLRPISANLFVAITT